MKNKHQALLVAALAGVFLGGVSEARAEGDCLRYGRDLALDGVLTRMTAPADPDLGEWAAKPNTYWVLTLPAEVCVAADPGDPANGAVGATKQIQLALKPEDYDRYRDLLDTPITARGDLFAAISAHHRTPVLLGEARISHQSRSAADFQAFWRNFSRAAAIGDCATLATTTTGRLESRGTLDSDPIQRLGPSEVERSCPAWLEADAGLVDGNRTARAFFASSQIAPPATWRIVADMDDQARVGGFGFAVVEGQWRWSVYYRSE